jgi:hypothetical protein
MKARHTEHFYLIWCSAVDGETVLAKTGEKIGIVTGEINSTVKVCGKKNIH